MEIGQSAGKNYAYILGVYLGDGCVTNNGYKLCFRLNTIDRDFADKVAQTLQALTGKNAPICTYPVKKSSKPNHGLQCNHHEFSEYLRIVTDDKKTIPKFVWSWTDEEIKQLVIGLMDSEGYVAEKTENKTGRAYYMGFKSCDVWVPDFVRLLHKIGIQIGKVSQCPPLKAHYKIPTRFHIKMQSWVDSGMRFNIARKQERVDRWAATEPYSERSRFPRKLSSETA